MNKAIFIFSILGTLTCSAQKEANLLLPGKWELVVEEKSLSENEAEISFSGSVTETKSDDQLPKTFFIFKPADSLHIIRNKAVHRTTYKVIDSTLVIGNNKLNIFKISDKELILQEDGLADKRYIYHRRE